MQHDALSPSLLPSGLHQPLFRRPAREFSALAGIFLMGSEEMSWLISRALMVDYANSRSSLGFDAQLRLNRRRAAGHASELKARLCNKQENEMSRLGSLYIELGEPEGELCGCTCEVGDWAADEIRRLRAELDKYRGQVNQYGEDTASDELKVHNT